MTDSNEIISDMNDFLNNDSVEEKNVNFMIPDFFLNNIDHGIFVILLYIIIILICYKINNLYFRFLSFVIISLVISSKYGVSMGLIFFMVTINKPKNMYQSILYIILILGSLFHIFIPIFSINFSNYGNYIFECFLFIITMLVIWYFNDKVTFNKITSIINQLSTNTIMNTSDNISLNPDSYNFKDIGKEIIYEQNF